MELSPYDLTLWEISRRVLKSEKLIFSLDEGTNIDIQNLSNSISDYAPTVIIDFKICKGGKIDQIIIANDNKILGFVGKDEPMETDCIWIPYSSKEFWKDFERRILYLVEAGYPGCIGCGGPGTDDEWNEINNRKEFRK
jgi:hypothetical protein